MTILQEKKKIFVKVMVSTSMTMTVQPEGTNTASEIRHLVLGISLESCVIGPSDLPRVSNKRNNIYHIMYNAIG